MNDKHSINAVFEALINACDAQEKLTSETDAEVEKNRAALAVVQVVVEDINRLAAACERIANMMEERSVVSID